MKTSEFSVPGVPQDKIWQLLNVWWYSYYLKKVQTLRAGLCEFCQLDRKINVVTIENDHWMLWENTISPLPHQEHQIVIASRRHLEHFDDLEDPEMLALRDILKQARQTYELPGYGGLVRSGDYRRNAKTVEHLHFNVHVPDGSGEVRPFLGKALQTEIDNLPVIQVFERMRLLEEASGGGLFTGFQLISAGEKELVKNRLAPPVKN